MCDLDKTENGQRESSATRDATVCEDTKLLGAWTGTAYLYPPFWNLSMVRDCGDVVLTIRQPAPEPTVEGASQRVRFTRQSWREFVARITEMNAVYQAADNLDAIL